MLIKYGSNSRYTMSINNKEALRKVNNNNVYYVTHVARDGETFDGIAQRILGDFTRFWEIADINPQIKFPNRLTAGQIVRIPQ